MCLLLTGTPPPISPSAAGWTCPAAGLLHRRVSPPRSPEPSNSRTASRSVAKERASSTRTSFLGLLQLGLTLHCLGQAAVPGPLSRCPGHSFIHRAWREMRETRVCRARSSRATVPALPGLLQRCPRFPSPRMSAVPGPRTSAVPAVPGARREMQEYGKPGASHVPKVTVPKVTVPKVPVPGPR
ncbi:unnamed protein product [Boreogadus saida]